jgi:hypothetical protein
MAESLEDNVGRRGVLPAAVCCLFLSYAFLCFSLSLSLPQEPPVLSRDSQFSRKVQALGGLCNLVLKYPQGKEVKDLQTFTSNSVAGLFVVSFDV